MASSAVESTIDIAFWFLNRASAEDSYLQPHKLQRLLYLAQGYYAQEHYGRKLMPATFVVHDLGPIEPNVFRLFEEGRPSIVFVAPPPEVEDFLERIWRRFNGHAVDRLNAMILEQPAYKTAVLAGEGEEIPFAAMQETFKIKEKEKAETTVRTADGRTVEKWIPTRAVRWRPQ